MLSLNLGSAGNAPYSTVIPKDPAEGECPPAGDAPAEGECPPAGDAPYSTVDTIDGELGVSNRVAAYDGDPSFPNVGV